MGLVERLESQLSLNRTLLVEITSEEKDLEAQNEELEEHASGLQQAFKVALDTPLQTAIYTIHQFEEHGYDLFGTRYAFITFFNRNMCTRFGIC